MALVKVQHWFQHTSQLPEDRFVNTFHFDRQSPSYDSAQAFTLLEIVRDFYQVKLASQTKSLQNWMSSSALGANAGAKLYAGATPPPNPPFMSMTYTPSGTGNAIGFPQEVACVLSFRGAAGPGLDAKRRRGRIYIGPLAENASEQIGGNSMVSANFMGDLLSAAIDLNLKAQQAGWSWGIHSPTTGPDSFIDIRHFAIDNAWDTIRSRGVKRTVRFDFDVLTTPG